MDEVSPSQRVETKRLILRRLRATDFESVFAMAADSGMWRFPERPPMSSEEAWNLLLRHEGSWQVVGYGVFAVEERLTGSFVGLTGFSDFRRRMGPDLDPYPEITWTIIPSAQGQGYATEAGKAVTEWLDRQVRCKQSVCLIHQENSASIAVARKLGYEKILACEYKSEPSLLLRRLAQQ